MNVEKRNFSNFTIFPGGIVGNSYVFPKLYHTDSRGNLRSWQITIRLVKGGPKKKKIDWNLMEDDIVPIKKKYLETTDIPGGTCAQAYTETGVVGGKITRHPPTYPMPANVGRSNERNVLKQGLVLSRTLFLKKQENGSRVDQKISDESDGKYFPMLVRKYDDEKKHMKFPLYVQPKLDGARCIAYLDKAPEKNPTYKNIIMYSRQKKNYTGFDDMRKAMLDPLCDLWDCANNQSLYIDGELYKHGLALQVISGAVRNPNRDTIAKYAGIKFYVFDAFYPGQPDPFELRMQRVDDLFDVLNSNLLVKVKTTFAKTESAQEKLYKQYLSKKYEGVILRNADSLYLTHPTKNNMKIRSKFVLKRKMTYSAEFEVSGYTQGKKGKDKGAIIWICQTADGEHLFNATPKYTTYKKRYDLFNLADKNNGNGFKKLYHGRMMTVEYEDLSKNGVPLRAKAAGFRDHI